MSMLRTARLLPLLAALSLAAPPARAADKAAPLPDQGPMFEQVYAAATPICRIMADPARHDGAKMMVAGRYGETPHERIMGDSCPAYRSAQLQFTTAGAGYDKVLHRRFLAGRKAGEADGFRIIVPVQITVRKAISPCDEPGCHEVILTGSDIVIIEPERK